MNPTRRPLALIILDGWGLRENRNRNAIAMANTPYYDEICQRYPMTTLAASGTGVGLPKGSPGSPEAGHLNLGAGRKVITDKCRIDDSIETDAFFENPILVEAIQRARDRGTAVHLAGLLSDAGVHSTSETLFALLRLAKRQGVSQVFVHCFLDGYDVPVKTADIYVEALEVKMAEIGIGKIASLCGRHFAMDSNGNWERTARAYTMMVHAEGEGTLDPKTAVRNAFLRGLTDEFIPPIIVENHNGAPIATIRDGDVMILFNHRGDAMRQLADAIAASGEGGGMPFTKPRIDLICMTEYDSALTLPIAFPPPSHSGFLIDVLGKNGICTRRYTEGERRTHLGNLFEGTSDGRDPEIVSVNSPDAAQRLLRPEMCSFKIADRLFGAVDSDDAGVVIVNIPAAALVAETGDLETTIEAVQYVDTCLGGLIDRIREVDGTAIITASHGSSEEMTKRSSGGGNYRASRNPVPFHLIDGSRSRRELRTDGALEDVAPTILALLGIEKPVEMSGRDLRVH